MQRHPSISTRPRRLPAALACLLLLTLGACSTAAPTPEAAAAKTPAALRQRLTDLVGDARCSDDAQCRTLPLGAKPCGGPEGWLPWSTLQTQDEPLLTLGRQYAEARRLEAQKQGLLSNCIVQADPGAQCVANRCVLRQVQRTPLPQ